MGPKGVNQQTPYFFFRQIFIYPQKEALYQDNYIGKNVEAC